MTDINQVILVGRATRDPEIRYTSQGAAVTRFSIATNKSQRVDNQWKDKANFFDIVAFGRTAENIKKYLSKGKLIAISGELSQNRWEKEDGSVRSRVEILVNRVQFLFSPNEASSGEYARTENTHSNQNIPAGEEDFFDEDTSIPY